MSSIIVLHMIRFVLFYLKNAENVSEAEKDKFIIIMSPDDPTRNLCRFVKTA